MRVLFASLASVGHCYPLIPLAVAARKAGHEVHFAAGEAVHAPLAANGLRPFRPADAFSEIYPEDIEPDLRRLQPDLVVHEWGLPGVAVAARRAGIPGIWHGFGRMIPEGIGFELPTRNTEAPGLPHIDICPPSLQDKEFLAGEHRIPLRPVPYSEPAAPRARDTVRNSRPLVYLTLGTVFGTAELFTTVLSGLGRLDAQIVAATGRVRPDDLSPVPGNTVLYGWVSQADLLPHADVVVHHGGSGTMLAALTFGVPQLILPQGADQFANAEALTTSGASLHLHPHEITPETIAVTTHRLLPRHDSPHRDAARALAHEITRMPGPDEVAHHLREYAR
ncbi:glycosyltransferase [Nocardia thraciensis]